MISENEILFKTFSYYVKKRDKYIKISLNWIKWLKQINEKKNENNNIFNCVFLCTFYLSHKFSIHTWVILHILVQRSKEFYSNVILSQGRLELRFQKHYTCPKMPTQMNISDQKLDHFPFFKDLFKTFNFMKLTFRYAMWMHHLHLKWRDRPKVWHWINQVELYFVGDKNISG